MKRSRAAWLTLAVVLLIGVVLVLFAPARWVLWFVQPRLHGVHLEQVHGLLWNGAAETVRAPDGRRLGRVHWQISRSALWGRLDLIVDFDGPQLAAHGHLRRDAQGRQVWSDVTAHAVLSTWAPLLDSSLGTPQGALDLTFDHALVQAGWPVELQGQAQWNGAAMRTSAGIVRLGKLSMDLAGAHGVLNGRIHDGGGPLRAQGQWQASPLGWRLDLRLQPRTGDPLLRRWLARLGQPGADGSVQLHRRGGLAVAAPGAMP